MLPVKPLMFIKLIHGYCLSLLKFFCKIGNSNSHENCLLAICVTSSNLMKVCSVVNLGTLMVVVVLQFVNEQCDLSMHGGL